MKIGKKILKGIMIMVLALIFYFNYSLYYTPDYVSIPNGKYNKDVYRQLSFIKSELAKGAAEEMQRVYPEGFLFANALYGLNWIEFIQDLPKSSAIYKEGIEEVNWVSGQITTPACKAVFNKKLPLKYGAFYIGWSNYFLGKKLLLPSKKGRSLEDEYLYKENCEHIKMAINACPIPYLESYSGETWPADGVIVMASLHLYQQIYNDNKYKALINQWSKSVALSVDNKTGLIPHKVYSRTGEILDAPRGSSQSLMLIFLNEIDNDLSFDLFEKYKDLFLDKRLGLLAIREYPKGSSGNGDIDSGPVIFGVGGAASIVGQKTMAMFREWTIYECLRNCIEIFTFGKADENYKKHLFGKLIMADIFIAWSNASEKDHLKNLINENWRIKFQMGSIALMSLLVIGIVKL